jgi:hypothetical protein
VSSTPTPLNPAPTGIVVLLDSLGTRTSNLDQAGSYLLSLEDLKKDVEGTLKVYLEDHPKETLKFYEQLKIRFFGDSMLITYETQQKDSLHLYIEYLYTALSFLYIAAFDRGILFRGAISIGEFIERENVVLGPAVNDAASWYDRFDLIGAAATPECTLRIRNAYYQQAQKSKDAFKNIMLHYDVPIKGGGSESLFAVNWPCRLGYARDAQEQTPETVDWLRDYFALMAKFPIPLGAERKFANTEVFVRRSVEVWEARYKKAIADYKASSATTIKET